MLLGKMRLINVYMYFWAFQSEFVLLKYVLIQRYFKIKPITV